ncbi:MAG: hypothetical protein GEV06_03065 [Luteitalea sp.]|nr:hypothetical protein [Luteitalea sp.]
MTRGYDDSFFRLGAIGAALYLGAQLFQAVAFWWLPVATAPGEAIALRQLPLDQIRNLVVLLGFVPLLVAYTAAALTGARRFTGSAILAITFTSLFVALEIGYRSIDLFGVSLQWASEYTASPDAAARAAVIDRIHHWEQIVVAWYFGLLLTHGAASICLAWVVRRSDAPATAVVSLLFALNALRILARMLEMHAGVHGLAPLNAVAYFPMVVVLYGTLTYWLLKQRGSADQAPVLPGTRPA